MTTGRLEEAQAEPETPGNGAYVQKATWQVSGSRGLALLQPATDSGSTYTGMLFVCQCFGCISLGHISLLLPICIPTNPNILYLKLILASLGFVSYLRTTCE